MIDTVGRDGSFKVNICIKIYSSVISVAYNHEEICARKVTTMSLTLMVPIKGRFNEPMNHTDEREKWPTNVVWSVVIDVLVADQLNIFIVFKKTHRPPERCSCPFAGAYGA